MTSIIEAIRAAEAQIPQWRDQLRALQAEAHGDDGVVDAEEQAEIDQVESMIDTAQRLVAEKLKTWGANKTAYEKLRSRTVADLGTVEANEDATFSQDKRAVSDAVAAADQAASVEDYATALSHAQELERLIELFLQLVENERLNGLTTEELMEISLADEGIDEVFTEEYMEALMGMTFAGEGTPELKDVIKKIEKGLSGANRAEVLGELAEIVGEPPTTADLDADYARFLILCKQRDAIGKEGDKGEIDPVDEELHPDFVGSHEQLMFGRVLGDALGIHEVFATLLSPTGGLVGPGNMLIGSIPSPHLSPDNPVALHGTVHDAAGYLDSFHDEGPGYNYRGSEIEAMVTSAIELLPQSWENEILPFTGQLSGIGYWIVEAGDEYIEARFDEGLVALEQALDSARDGASDQIDEIVSAIEDAKQEISDKADALRSDMEDAAAEAAQDLQDLVDQAKAEMLEASDALEDGFEKVSETVVETIENVSDAIGSFGKGVGEKLDALANFIWG
ncbi:MAG TPA: hypothetical protein EYG79_10095 [Rhodobacteraceae bacterium]|nr:hypothetical protein [Paracoccaceae bacterium]